MFANEIHAQRCYIFFCQPHYHIEVIASVLKTICYILSGNFIPWFLKNFYCFNSQHLAKLFKLTGPSNPYKIIRKTFFSMFKNIFLWDWNSNFCVDLIFDYLRVTVRLTVIIVNGAGFFWRLFFSGIKIDTSVPTIGCEVALSFDSSYW